MVVKDRFDKMRMFTRCFDGLEVVNFLSEDQLLERDKVCVFFFPMLLSRGFFFG